jgi:hypothetical protein
MKRRGFLGLLGGAAVAGPAAAKNTIATSALGSGNLASGLALRGGSYGLDNAANAGSGMFSAFERVTKLKRLLSGEEMEQRDPYSHASRRRIYAEHQLSALHSVSMPMKLQILARKTDEIEAEQRRGYWLLELMNLERGGG